MRGSGAGRPAKGYEATDKEILVSYPARRYDLLAELLVRVIERVAPDDAPSIAEEIGREYGRELVAEVGTPGEEEGVTEALAAVTRAMVRVGFGIAPDEDLGTLVTIHCPFGATAANHPEVVCRLDQGIVRGLMEAIGDRGDSAVVTPHTDPDEACITEV
jgi:predicted ArsR family transcriptional regulator